MMARRFWLKGHIADLMQAVYTCVL